MIDAASGKVRFPRTNVLKSYALNLYQDGGRMGGNGAAATSLGAFSWPAYLSLNNGSAAAVHAKFINDNADYGGAGGALGLYAVGRYCGDSLPYQDPTPQLLAIQRDQIQTAKTLAATGVVLIVAGAAWMVFRRGSRQPS